MSKTERLNAIETVIQDAKKESDLIVQEAQLTASKIISEAEIAAKEILIQKENIERELKEFIQIEKELIKKYEEKE
jgi:cell division septum initiation protein DivIVA